MQEKLVLGSLGEREQPRLGARLELLGFQLFQVRAGGGGRDAVGTVLGKAQAAASLCRVAGNCRPPAASLCRVAGDCRPRPPRPSSAASARRLEARRLLSPSPGSWPPPPPLLSATPTYLSVLVILAAPPTEPSPSRAPPSSSLTPPELTTAHSIRLRTSSPRTHRGRPCGCCHCRGCPAAEASAGACA